MMASCRAGFERFTSINRKALFVIPDVDLRPDAQQLPELAADHGPAVPASSPAGATCGKRRYKSRPSLSTDEIADHVLGGLRAGQPLRRICRDDGMPCYDTIMSWVHADRAGFAARYRQARAIGHGSPGPVRYTREIADRFLGEPMGGRMTVEICDDPGMPDRATINRWVTADLDSFGTRYRSARDMVKLRRAEVPYSEEIADRILDGLMEGKLQSEVCSGPDMPCIRSLQNWVKEDRDGFRARYLVARQIGFHMIADETLKIVDDRRNDWIVHHREDGTTEFILDPHRVKRAKARVKARQWLLSKMMPKTFGNPRRQPDSWERDQGLRFLRRQANFKGLR
jgi:hypothetical protein